MIHGSRFEVTVVFVGNHQCDSEVRNVSSSLGSDVWGLPGGVAEKDTGRGGGGGGGGIKWGEHLCDRWEVELQFVLQLCEGGGVVAAT